MTKLLPLLVLLLSLRRPENEQAESKRSTFNVQHRMFNEEK